MSDPGVIGHDKEGLVTKLVPVGDVVWSVSRRDSIICAWDTTQLGVCVQAVNMASLIPEVRIDH